VELSERRFGHELERRSHFDSCSFTQRFTYVLSLSGQFRYVGIQASDSLRIDAGPDRFAVLGAVRDLSYIDAEAA
jgi:hypothetical protein